MNETILKNAVAFTLPGHISTDISPREYLLAVKYLVGNEKNMRHVVPKSQKVWKKVKR